MRNSELPVFGAELYRTGQTGAGRSGRAVSVPADLKSIWTAFVTYRLTVAIVFCAAIIAAIGYIWITPPTYRATAEIIIDPRKRDIIDKEIVQSGLGTSSLGPDTFLLDSQVEVMLSQSVLRGLIARTHLLSDPEFVGGPRTSATAKAVDFVKRLIRGPQAERIGEMSEYERALAALTKRLDIKRKGNTYVFAVSMRSEDSAKAAEIANALVSDYIDEVNRSSRERIQDASRLLETRLGELRRSVAESREKVEAFRRANGLLSAERLPVTEQQLRDLNIQLARVATTANSARSRWEEVAKLQKMSPDVALASGLIESPSLSALRDRAAALTLEERSLSNQLMDRHPAITAVRESRAALERLIRAEISRIIARSKYEWEVAASEESSLRKRIATLETATAQSNRANVTLQELQREADANTAIYEQFLVRSKSAREQINIPSETVGLISKAFPPTRPSWPIEPLVLAFAAFAGLVLGLLAAIVRHARSGAAKRPARSKPTLSVQQAQPLARGV